ASTQIEKLTCADAILSIADEQMATAFRIALRKAPGKTIILADQRAWLKNRSICMRRGSSATKIDCLISMTQRRRDELYQIVSSDDLPGESTSPTMSDSVIGQRIQGRCHMDYCSWFSIGKRIVHSRAQDGILYRVEIQHWSSYHPEGAYEVPAPLEDDGQSSSYVFCSLARPAVFNEDDSKWIVSTLAPGSDSGIYGYNMTSYIFYFAVCHDIITDAGETMTPLARRLGYSRFSDEPGQWQISSPDDYLDN
ncbi:MAG TPA: lysozyme inhibitor LprI family protein, partial [Bellilinea sp.]|nr:lysozyme inhibitor LprI family protein [Bellilinea sp.]